MALPRRRRVVLGGRRLGLEGDGGRGQRCLARRERQGGGGSALVDLVCLPVRLQRLRIVALPRERRGQILQPLRVPPRPAEPPVAQGHQHADGDHAGVPGLLLGAGRVDEGAQPRVGAVVDEVDEVVGDGVQARGQRLVLDAVVNVDARRGAAPGDGVALLDVEVYEEEGVDGREVGEGGTGLDAGRQRHGEGGPPAACGGHDGRVRVQVGR